jgi:hypothetical protein
MSEPEAGPPLRWSPADALWIALMFLVALLLQGLQSQNYFDGDTGYHIAVGRYTLQHGILHEFPWTPFSWLGAHYADKELLLHLLLAPLSLLDPNLAARIAGACMGGALLSVLYVILRVERVERAGAWALLLLLLSGAFTHRFVLVRPHVMSISLALLVLWSAARGRWALLALSCFAFPFAYTAWHLTLALAFIGAGARLLGRAPQWWAPAPIAGLCLALGVLSHPNFPENLSFFWIQNVEVLFQTAWSDRPGFELGGEFQPFSPMGLLRYGALPALALVAALALQLRARRADPLALAASAAGLGMLVMTLQTQRFVEYFVPFSLLAALSSLGLAALPGALRPAQLVVPVLGLSFVWTASLGSAPLRMLAGRSIIYPPDVEEAVQQLIPTGAQVFHCDWLTVGEAMLALPDRRFLFALDPVLFYRGDPVAYDLWFRLLHEPVAKAGDGLRDVIHADYVLCDQRPEWAPLNANLAADPSVSGPLPVGPLRLWKVLPAGADPSGPPPATLPAPP